MPRRLTLPPVAIAIALGVADAAEFHPIANVSSSSAGDLYPVANLIQGAGSGFSASEPHGQLGSGASHYWVTAAPGGFPSDYIEQTGKPVLTFDLGQDRALSEISVWGYTSSNANGVSEFSLRFATAAEGSANLGSSISYNPTFAPINDDVSRQSFAFSEVVVARYVEFTCEDNFYSNGGFGPPGGGDRVGLGEVAFEDAVPNPNPVIEVAALLDFGNPSTYPGPVSLPLAIANLGGDQTLQVTAASLDPDPGSAGVFTVAGVPLAIAAGGNGQLDITFDPGASEGCFSAQLELTTNDPARPSVTILLSGGINCTAPEPEKPVFSVDGGTFTGSFELSLTTGTPGAFILYTTDGSSPALGNGTLYDSPLIIDASTQVRAATISGGHEPAVATESYVRLAADLAAYSSQIPILIVENFAAGEIPNKGWSTSTQTGAGLVQPERQAAYIGIFDTDPDAGTASISAPPATDSRIGIRVRGAFSSTWNPKPYSVEAWKQSRDEDRDISPLGMPSDSDWILYFPHPNYDRTMLNNTFIWELAGETGRYGTRFRFVDVFVNEDGGDLKLSDRRGVYAFAEKVKRGGDRIDFEPLSDDGTTGGWLLAINRMDPVPAAGYPTENGATSPQFFHTPGPNRIAQTPANTSGQGDDIPRQYNAFINFENPNGYRINADQRAAIEAWFAEFENVLYDDALWLHPTDGYRRYVDTTDVITYFQLLNLAKQGDGLLLSMFPWVSSGERQLHMGPMWDFNNGAYGGNTDSPLYFRQDRLWYPRLFQDPSFLREYIDRWFELRRGPLSDASMHAIIDRQAAAMPDALVPGQGIALGTWQSRVTGMKSWLSARASWIDSQYFAPPDFSHPGGVVGPGFAFTLSNNTGTAGTIYYTLDGSDPFAGDAPVVTETLLVDAGAPATALVPSPENGGAALDLEDWTNPAPPPNGANWTAGTTGAGYQYPGLIGLDLEAAMRREHPTAYVRIPFQVDGADIASWNELALRMKYDDGFVAYLNGSEVASANSPEEPAWDSAATAPHPDQQAVVFQEFDLSAHLGALTPGTNMLAIHLLNDGSGSSDALALPQLVAAKTTVGSPGAVAYTDPVPLSGSATLRARIRTDDGQWSALNSATYVVGTPADNTNLVISEIMYHPADGAGMEFIELLNIHPTETIELTGSSFTTGINYDFPPGTTLAPGERLVLTQADFQNDTRLANGGERIVLTAVGGATIHDFTYDDRDPWPEPADGDGFSLVLIDPESNPDHSEATNWRRSRLPGGNPGSGDAESFSGDPKADADRDGVSALIEHATGGSDAEAGDRHPLTISADPGDGSLLVELRRNVAAEDAELALEHSTGLDNWLPAAEAEFVGQSIDSGGISVERWRLPIPSSAEGGVFVRLRATLR